MGCHRQKCKCFDQLTTGINVLHHLRAIIPLGRCAYGGHPHLLGVDEQRRSFQNAIFFSHSVRVLFLVVYIVFMLFLVYVESAGDGKKRV